MPVPAFLRTYKTEKFIRVDVPRVGYLHRSCQLIAFFLVFVQLYFNDGWGFAEVPGGIANGWDEAGQMLRVTNDLDYEAAQPYCQSSADPDLSYSEEAYMFLDPTCEVMLPAELTQKTSKSVFFTTAVLETVTKGWPCSDASASTKEADCTAGGGATFTRTSGQCGCVTEQAKYPLAVEEMNMAFEHAFETTPKVGMSMVSSDNDDMYSDVIFGNGTSRGSEGTWKEDRRPPERCGKR